MIEQIFKHSNVGRTLILFSILSLRVFVINPVYGIEVVMLNDSLVTVTRHLPADTYTNTSRTGDELDLRQPFEIFVDKKLLFESDPPDDFTVTIRLLSGESTLAADQTMTVTVRGSGDASAVDFEPVSNFTITVNANERSGSATFRLTPVNDTVDEIDEMITITSTSDMVSGSATISLMDDDPAPRGITLNTNPVAVYENEGGQVVTITASVEGRTTYGQSQSIPISVSGTLAPTSVDFAEIPDFTIEISAEQQSGTGTFTVTPTDDNVDETDETLTVTTTHANVLNKSLTLPLRDDDPAPRGINIVLNTNAVYEDLGAQEVKVSLQIVLGPLRNTYATDQVITLTATGTNKEGVVSFQAAQSFDIVLPAESLTSSEMSFIITPVNNLIDEENEIITINSRSPLITGPGIINVVDDDVTPSIELSVNPSSINEGAGDTAITVTGTLSSDVVFPEGVVIPLTVAGSGNTSSVDFRSLPFSILLIRPRESTGSSTFFIHPIDDSEDEDNETITISSTSDLVSNSTTIQLVDNDAPPSNISLSTSPSTLNEGDGATSITVTASLGSSSTFSESTSFVIDVTGSGNSNAVKYSSVSNFTIVFGPGESTVTETLVITPTDDEVDTDHEQITLSGRDPLITGSALIELFDNDDVMRLSIFLRSEPSIISERDGATIITVTGSFGDAQTSTQDLAIPLTVTGSGLEDAVDFTSVSDLNLTMTAGQPSSSVTFILTPEDDLNDEINETVTISSNHPDVVSDATVIIEDDDEPGQVILTATPKTIFENLGPQTITITGRIDNRVAFNEDKTFALSIKGSAGPNAVDFEPISDIDLEFEAGVIESTISFTVTPINDREFESDEILVVSSTDPSIAVSDATVIIQDDDEPGQVILTATPKTIFENLGPQTITITGRIDNRVAFNEDKTFALSIKGSAGPNAVDFEPISDIDLEFEAGVIESTISFTVTPIDDREFESDEILVVSSTDPSIAVSDATVIIQDDDEPGQVILTATPKTIFENLGPQTITITGRIDNRVAFNEDKTFALSIKGSAGPNAVDFEPISDIGLEFEAGVIESTISFTVTPIDDREFESDEILVVSSTDPSIAGSVSIELSNDDENPQQITLSVTPSSIQENAGSTKVTVKAMINGPSQFSSAVELPLTVTGSNDPNAVTFLPVTDLVLRIPPRTSTGSIDFQLTPQDNTFHQPDGVISIQSTSELVSDPVEITLINDDPLPNAARLSVNPNSISESNGSTSVNVTATLQGETTFSVDQTIIITAEGSGVSRAVNFTSIPDFELTIPAQSLTGSILIQLTIEDDLIDEQNEVITFGSANSLIANEATLTLVDDDATPSEILLSLNQSTLLESSGNVEVTVTTTLIGDSRFASDKPYNLSITDSGNPNAVQYVANAPSTVTLPSGQSLTRTTIEITPTDNLLDETDEVLTITISDESITATTALSIVDDDEPPTGFVVNATPQLIVEGDGATQVTVSASLTGASRYATPQMLQISVSDAQDGSVGYENVQSFMIDVPAGAQSGRGSFTLTPQINTIPEQDAVITITATHLSTTVTATIILQDDDASTQRIADVNEGLLPDLTRAMISSSVGAVSARFQSNQRASSKFTDNLSHVAMRFQNHHANRPLAQHSLASQLMHMRLATSIKDKISIWSYADYRMLSGDGNDFSVDYDGGLTGIHAGVDLALNRFLVGLAVSQFFGDVDFEHLGRSLQSSAEGLYKLNTLTFNPYASWAWGSGSKVWTMLSLGSGNAEVTDPETTPEEANTTLNAFAAGVDLRLFTAPSGFTLTGSGALWGGLSSLDQNISRIRELDVGVYRFQVSVEGAYAMDLHNLGTLEPFIETGLRGDGGDGLTGAGIEMGGGTRLDLNSVGLQIQVQGHVLALHGADVSEWGIGGSVRYAPGGRTGPRFEINSTTGQAPGHLQQIWEETRWHQQGTFINRGTRLQSRAGYGFRLGHGTMTPYAGVTFGSMSISQMGADYRLGSHLSVRLESTYQMTSYRQSPSVRASVLLR